MVVSFSAVACSDDDGPLPDDPTQPDDPGVVTPPVIGAGSGSVSSEPGPQPHQSHQSSDNFSTVGLEGNYLVWTCPDGISFDIWIDKTGKDGVFQSGVSNGSITPSTSSSKLYIANPKGATQKFTIRYSAFDDDTDALFINSSNGPLNGEKHR